MKSRGFFLVIIFLFSAQIYSAPPLRLDSLLALLKTPGEDTAKASTMVRIGRQYFYSQPDSAKYYFESGLRISQKFKYDYGIAYALTNLGDFYMAAGKYAESLRSYLKSLSILEALGKESMVASCHNNIGLVYLSIGSMDEAQKHCEIALQFFQANDRPDHVMNILNNLGMIYFGKQEYAQAEASYRESLKLREEAKSYKGSVLQNLGELMAACGYNDSAMAYFQLSLAEKIANNRLVNMVSTYKEMGSQYMLSGQDAQAFDSFQKGYSIAKENGLLAERAGICADLAELMAKKGEWEQAYAYEHESQGLQDSIFNPDMVKEMSRLEVDYTLQRSEIEKQELRYKTELAEANLKGSRWLTVLSLAALLVVLALLVWIYRLNLRKGQINKDLNQLNAELEVRVQQRTESLQNKTEVLEKYAFDLSHRLRSPVASILGLTDLIAAENPNSPDNKTYISAIKVKAENLDQVFHELNAGLK